MTAIDEAVRERHLEETLRDILAAPAAEDARHHSRRPRLAVITTMLLAAAVVVIFALSTQLTDAPQERPAGPPFQDPIVPRSDAVIVRSAEDIDALPEDVREVACRRLPERAYRRLTRLPLLEALTVSGEMDGDGLHFLRYPLPAGAMQQVAKLPRLRKLHFVAVDAVTPDDLEQLHALPMLEELYLRQVDELDDAHLRQLVGLRRLQRLWLGSRGDITDAGLATLLDGVDLDELHLRGTYALTTAGYQRLRHEPTLRVLDLSAPWFLAPGDAVRSAPWPDASTRPVDDSVLAAIAELSALHTLRLGSRTAVTDEGLAHLASLRNLRTLDLNQCYGITDSGLERMQLEHLHDVVLRECPGIRGLPTSWSQLRAVDLRFCAGVADEAVAELLRTAPVEALDASDCPQLTGKCVDAIAACSSLRELRLQAHRWLDDAVLDKLADLPHLHTLHVGSYLWRGALPAGPGKSGGPTRITGTGVAHLARAHKLRLLNLNAASPIDASCLRTLRSLPLQSLSLAWVEIRYDDNTRDLEALRAIWPTAQVYWYPR